MEYGKWMIGLVMLSLLLIAGCGLLGSDDDYSGPPGMVVFSARPSDGGHHQIFTMRPDGSERRQLTDMNGPSVQPSWSPDGEQIVFSSFNQHTSIGPALWVMDADGSNMRPLFDPEPDNIHSPPLPGNNPRWSPDGRKIAFDLCVNCQVSTNSAIFVFDLETEEMTRLTEEPAGYSSMYASWSPDGSRIAFTANRDYVGAETDRWRRDLYVMDSDGENQTRITETGYMGWPIWSPNSLFILSRITQPSRGLYKVDLQSNDIIRIKEDLSTRVQFQPHAWSSIGTQILTTTWELDPPRTHTLYILNIEDGSLEEVYSQTSPNSNPVIQGADWYVPVSY